MPKSILKNLACLGIVGVFTLILTCAGVIGFTGYFGYGQLKAEAERFSANREQILAELKADLNAERYDDVINAGDKFVLVDDADLHKLVSHAKKQREDHRKQNSPEPSISELAAPTADSPKPRQTAFDIVESCVLRAGPSDASKRKVNEKATRMLGETHYQQVDSSVTVEVLQRKDGWAEIRVLQPEHLRNSHRGWIPESAVDAGPATDKRDGWIRIRCDVYDDADLSSLIVGHLTPPSSVGVADDGSGWLRLMDGPIQGESDSGFVDTPDFDGGLYIKKNAFTTVLPANW